MKSIWSKMSRDHPSWSTKKKAETHNVSEILIQKKFVGGGARGLDLNITALTIYFRGLGEEGGVVTRRGLLIKTEI
jgi:hypothetical protein